SSTPSTSDAEDRADGSLKGFGSGAQGRLQIGIVFRQLEHDVPDADRGGVALPPGTLHRPALARLVALVRGGGTTHDDAVVEARGRIARLEADTSRLSVLGERQNGGVVAFVRPLEDVVTAAIERPHEKGA